MGIGAAAGWGKGCAVLAADSARSNSLVGCSGPYFLIRPGSWVLPDTLSTAAITGQTLTAFWRRQAQHFSGFTDNKKQEIVRRVTTLHRHIPSLFLAKRFSIVLYSDMGFSGMTWPWGEASEERGDETDTRRMQGGTGRGGAFHVPFSHAAHTSLRPSRTHLGQRLVRAVRICRLVWPHLQVLVFTAFCPSRDVHLRRQLDLVQRQRFSSRWYLLHRAHRSIYRGAQGPETYPDAQHPPEERWHSPPVLM